MLFGIITGVCAYTSGQCCISPEPSDVRGKQPIFPVKSEYQLCYVPYQINQWK